VGTRDFLAGAARAARRLPLPGERVTGIVESARGYVTEELGEPDRFVPIVDAERFQGRPGRSMGDEEELMAKVWTHGDWPAWRVSLPGGRVVGDVPLILTSDHRALRESAFDESHLRSNPAMRSRLPSVRRTFERLLVLVGPWAGSWYHWLLDLLPRAALLPLDEPDAEVLVPASLSPVQDDSLTLAGVPPDRRRPYSGGQISADELVFPSFVAATGNPPRWALRWLRERLAPPPERNDRRLYVSRADAVVRRVVNEAELMPVLRERGFETFVGSQLDLEGQFRAFAEAEVVVGPHGAGLANVCASTDATVIELHRGDAVNRCFFAQANAQQLEYWYLLCEPAKRADLRVDLAQLERTLDAAGVT
jgi:capsular polysaccharide biosynthesis protein